MQALTNKHRRILLRNRFIAIVAMVCLSLNPALVVQAQESDDAALIAGQTVLVAGQVIAADPTGLTRPLGRRDNIYIGDTIFTAANSQAQLRMSDGARIAIKAETEFSIIAYEFEDSQATDNVTLELIQGGFRTITGSISAENREAYQARAANFATIGIRGTDYEIVINPAGEVIAGVYDGGITISNDVASLDLGIEADFDFARVPNATTPPQGLLRQPVEMGTIAAQTIGDGLEEDDEENEEGREDDSADSENEPEAANEETVDGTTEETTEEELSSDDTDATPSDDTAEVPEQDDGDNSTTETEVATGPAPDAAPEPTATNDNGASIDSDIISGQATQPIAANTVPSSSAEPETEIPLVAVSNEPNNSATGAASLANTNANSGIGAGNTATPVANVANNLSANTGRSALNSNNRLSLNQPNGQEIASTQLTTSTGAIGNVSIDTEDADIDSSAVKVNPNEGNISGTSSTGRPITDRDGDGIIDAIDELTESENDNRLDSNGNTDTTGNGGSTLTDVQTGSNSDSTTGLDTVGSGSNTDGITDSSESNSSDDRADTSADGGNFIGDTIDNTINDTVTLGTDEKSDTDSIDNNTNGDSTIGDIVDSGIDVIVRPDADDKTDTGTNGDNSDTTNDGDRIDTTGDDNSGETKENAIDETITSGTDEKSGSDSIDNITNDDSTIGDIVDSGIDVIVQPDTDDNTESDSNGDNSDTTTDGDKTDTIAEDGRTDSTTSDDNTNTGTDGESNDTTGSGNSIGDTIDNTIDETVTLDTDEKSDTDSVDDNADDDSTIGDLVDSGIDVIVRPDTEDSTDTSNDNSDTTADSGKTDTSTDGDNTSSSTDGDKTDTNTDGDNTSSSTDGDKTDTSTDGNSTDTSTGGNTIGDKVDATTDGTILTGTNDSSDTKSDTSTKTDENTDSTSTKDESDSTVTGTISSVLGALSISESSIEQHQIDWGRWNTPVSENWFAIEVSETGLTRIETSDYFAEVNPTEVADMTGSYTYRTGIASSFIGSGSAGEISDLIAGMSVDFDSGLISNGKLALQVADQLWSVSFDGLVNQGSVELNALGGQLIESGSLLSNEIDAQLGGAFTGADAEAFVGGFDLLDRMNTFNEVNGLFTIER